MSEPTNPHDALFKIVFSKPENAASQFRALLPDEVLAGLDLGALRSCRGSFVDEGLRDSHSDLLFTAPLRGEGEALFYFLYEHRSTPSLFMCYHLLRYVVRVWDDWLEEHKGDVPAPKYLPPVLPLVLYHGPRPWSAPRRLQEILALPPGSAAFAARHLPEFELLLDDLTEHSDEELEARRSPPLADLALALLKHGRQGEDPLAVWRAKRGAVAALMGEPDWTLGLQAAARYTSHVGDVPVGDLARLVREIAGPEAEEAVMTTAEKLKREGKQEMLLGQLREKFGSELPTGTTERLEQATVAELDLWAKRVLTATSLDEVFAG